MEQERKKSELVAIQIEKAIIEGIYKPGDRLPPERVLAERYNVSRSILREAMKHIAGMGLVRTEPQSGTYVTDYGKEASLELLVYLMDNNETLNPHILRSLLEFRDILEIGAAGISAELKDEAFIDVLRSRLNNLRDANDNPGLRAEKDYELHATIIAQTDNIAFRLLFNACRSVYLFYAEEFYRVPGHFEQTLTQLEDLIQAFEDGDGRRASTVMRSTLEYGRESIYESLDIDIRAVQGVFGGTHGS